MKVGDAAPVLERSIEMVDLVAYSAATWDWHPLHYDSSRASQVGGEGPVVDGQMFGAVLAKQIIDWLGPDAFVTNMSLRYKSMVVAGATIVCEGTVTNVEPDAIELTQTIRNGDRIAVEATARIRL